YGRLKPSFHLYVPTSMMEVAKRLCTDHNVPVAEIHSYHQVGDELRFVPVYRAPADVRARAAAAAAAAHPPQAPEPRKGAKPATKPASRPSKGKTAARQPAKRKPATLRQAQGRPEQRRGTKKA